MIHAPHNTNPRPDADGKWRPAASSRRCAVVAAGEPVSSVPVGSNLVGAVPRDMLHDDEIIMLLIKPSLWFILLTSLRFIVTAVLLAILAVRVLSPDWLTVRSIALAAVAVVLVRLIWAVLVWISHIYLLTNQRVVTIKGVINVRIFQASLRKIQRTNLYRPIIQRLLRIGTLGFATAATTDLDSTWVMIPHPIAVQERVNQAIQRMS